MAKSTTPKPATDPAAAAINPELPATDPEASATNPELPATPPPNHPGPTMTESEYLAKTGAANNTGEGEDPPADTAKMAAAVDILRPEAPVATPLQILTAQIAGGICSGIIARRKPYDPLALDHEAIVAEAEVLARHILDTVQE